MTEFAVYSGQQDTNSWGWWHTLAWRQLSAIWQMEVQQYCLDRLPAAPTSANAYSLAIAPGEFSDLSALEKYYNAAPMVVFLDRFCLYWKDTPRIERTETYTPSDAYQYVFHVHPTGSLTFGLPEQVVMYGPPAEITPIPVEPGLQVLVSMDGKPVIAYHPPHLLIGCNPWQLGHPSVPLVYPVLKNWLSSIVGIDLKISSPYAMIRLDDLPATAEQLLHRQPAPDLDRQRAATLRRLRKFAVRSKLRLSLMYTSHYYTQDGSLRRIGDVMSRSIREMRLGVEQNVFEIGAHGLLHLRYQRATDMQDVDPREFFDLDEDSTIAHMQLCTEEIQRLFNVQPASFVAPAWGYRPGVTKKIAGQRFKVVIDSSQHMEDGSSNVFSVPGEEYPAFNYTETFRPGSRMLSYTSSDFWKCYALAGIPIHYLQHTDTNWHLLQSFLSGQVQQSASTSGKLSEYMQDAGNPRLGRAMAATWLLVTTLWYTTASISYLWGLLTASSLYVMVNAMQKAGYRCIGIAQFAEIIPEPCEE